MPVGHRLSTLLLVLALVGAPAVVLRGFCVGSSCDAGDSGTAAAVPFCSLPPELRREISAGFREGRSPDVMAATASLDSVSTAVRPNTRVSWPGSTGRGANVEVPDTRVPIAFFGAGVDPGAIPGGSTLDAIAPTLEAITGSHREHPDVRTGEAIGGVAIEDAGTVPLVVVIAWKGIGTSDLEWETRAWPFLRSAIREGAGSLDALTGSVPLDPAATLTTIGTGGLPSSHGITGTLLREDDGDVSEAWSTPDAGSIIATFADDLDHASNERASVAAILTDPSDRGIIGNGWYLDADVDDMVTVAGGDPRDSAVVAQEVVTSAKLGADGVTDVLAVVLEGRIARIDAATAEVVATVRELVPGATYVVAGTGSVQHGDLVDLVDAETVGSSVDTALGAEVVRGVTADGLFLDRDVLVERSITSERIADALRRERALDGEPLFADVYPSFAVAFSRYC